MLIGAMNHPERDVLAEIEWMARLELGFIDLTLEPPAAMCRHINIEKTRELLRRYNMRVVGHTAFYLPFASPFEAIRRASVEELCNCLAVFGALGAEWVNIHPDRNIPFQSRANIIERNLQSLRDALPSAKQHGVGLMIENLPGPYNNAQQLGELLDEMPELGLHLDIGHANLMVPENTTASILAAYGDRLRHVHLHDNKGGQQDLHLPLGAGTLDVRNTLAAVKKTGYDGTITLEVFVPDENLFAYSRDVLRRVWTELS
jgi:sugar phosphate isomerase/epimerase